ncbi:MAG: hypothetical protein WBK77_09360 [Alphaproteobacteria bacterium]
MTQQSVTESEFYMWRTLFALTHVDGKVSSEELRFMVEAIEDVPFTEDQEKTLHDDIRNKQDIFEMFEKISNIKDQARFFQYASDITWADGDYSKAEQDVLLKLQVVHLKKTDVDDLIGTVKLEFADETAPPTDKVLRKKKLVFSFRKRFLEDK